MAKTEKGKSKSKLTLPAFASKESNKNRGPRQALPLPSTKIVFSRAPLDDKKKANYPAKIANFSEKF